LTKGGNKWGGSNVNTGKRNPKGIITIVWRTLKGSQKIPLILTERPSTIFATI